ncbi:hypothetical protein B0T20DRAFT_491036 [Sordaria brevicollis]|uniref:Uncharacterized protein n=1 Tax=Sordaria brevicollis TaxID=83679 RepID=A0AAE0U296_SORBR|nr:hypothetical protein B0T20DRAFT_491036 [Sordaria brevicollis]
MARFSVSCPSWMPIWIRQFPLSLLANLFALVFLIVGNTVISCHFAGQPYAESFVKDPRKYMSLFAIIAGVVMNWSYLVAAENAYWNRATTKGLTLSEFHYRWMSAYSILEATTGFKVAKMVASACYIVVLAAACNSFVWPMSADHAPVTVTSQGLANVFMTWNTAPSSEFASTFTLDGPISAAQRAFYLGGEVQLWSEDVCEDCLVNALGFGWAVNCSVSNGTGRGTGTSSNLYSFDHGSSGAVLRQQPLFQVSAYDEEGPDNRRVLVVRSNHK